MCRIFCCGRVLRRKSVLIYRDALCFVYASIYNEHITATNILYDNMSVNTYGCAAKRRTYILGRKNHI